MIMSTVGSAPKGAEASSSGRGSSSSASGSPRRTVIDVRCPSVAPCMKVPLASKVSPWLSMVTVTSIVMR
jgi:hypothetical protein